MLQFSNDSKREAKLEGPADRYDDDWLFGRGATTTYDGVNSSASIGGVLEVLCIPKTLRNRECAYTKDDTGYGTTC